jgi:hypothetical protein
VNRPQNPAEYFRKRQQVCWLGMTEREAREAIEAHFEGVLLQWRRDQYANGVPLEEIELGVVAARAAQRGGSMPRSSRSCRAWCAPLASRRRCNNGHSLTGPETPRLWAPLLRYRACASDMTIMSRLRSWAGT